MSDNQATARHPEDVSIFGGAIRVGRHFQLVSTAPAAALVLGVYGLIAAGAPSGEPSVARIGAVLGSTGLVDLAVFVLVVVLVGMAMHPFEFATTQFLEGYWGTSRVGVSAMTSRASIHLRRRQALSNQLAAAEVSARMSRKSAETCTENTLEPSRIAIAALSDDLLAGQLAAAVGRYPPDPLRTLPTKLGNVLRSYEDMLGDAMSVDNAIALGPYLVKVGRPADVEHVHDARSALDLAIRFTIAWALLGVVGFALVWPYGSWVAVPIGAYLLAIASYRGAVHAASEYGAALQVLFDLNMTTLLRLFPQPGVKATAQLRRIAETASRSSARTSAELRDDTSQETVKPD